MAPGSDSIISVPILKKRPVFVGVTVSVTTVQPAVAPHPEGLYLCDLVKFPSVSLVSSAPPFPAGGVGGG